MRVLVLGASGFVGRHLTSALRRRGDDVVAASLRDPQAAAEAARTCAAIVNLAGEPIAQRWSPAVKARIVESRTAAPQRFLEALERLPRDTACYVSASGVGFYGTSESETFVEESPPGDDFLARTCVQWEAQAMRAHTLGLRVAIVRTGIALAGDGGALAAMLPPFRFGLGGRIGSGRQWYSWIHVDDLVGIYLAAIDRGEGTFNAVAPEPATNGAFARELASVLHRPAIVPVPAFALRALLGEAAGVALDGQRVMPRRTQGDLGYAFAFRRLAPALEEIFRTPSRAS